MAGVDQEFEGESRLSDWAKVGYLEQEPKLDDGETVTSNIEAAVVPTRTLLKEYQQVKRRMLRVNHRAARPAGRRRLRSGGRFQWQRHVQLRVQHRVNQGLLFVEETMKPLPLLCLRTLLQ